MRFVTLSAILLSFEVANVLARDIDQLNFCVGIANKRCGANTQTSRKWYGTYAGCMASDWYQHGILAGSDASIVQCPRELHWAENSEPCACWYGCNHDISNDQECRSMCSDVYVKHVPYCPE